MKEGIHPAYNQTTITCACGNVIEVGSTKKDLKVFSFFISILNIQKNDSMSRFYFKNVFL